MPRFDLVLAYPAVRGALDPLHRALEPLWEGSGLAPRAIGLDATANDDTLGDALLAALPDTQRPLVLGGFSLGARIAARVAAAAGAEALVCFGFPFHRPRDPGHAQGLEALASLQVPALIVQGTRDPHGSPATLRSLGPLPAGATVLWLEDGNHRLTPRARSGRSEAAHLRAAVEAVTAFLSLLEAPAHV